MCQILDGQESNPTSLRFNLILSSCNRIWIKAINVDIPIFGTACFSETLRMIH